MYDDVYVSGFGRRSRKGGEKHCPKKKQQQQKTKIKHNNN